MTQGGEANNNDFLLMFEQAEVGESEEHFRYKKYILTNMKVLYWSRGEYFTKYVKYPKTTNSS